MTERDIYVEKLQADLADWRARSTERDPKDEKNSTKPQIRNERQLEEVRRKGL